MINLHMFWSIDKIYFQWLGPAQYVTFFYMSYHLSEGVDFNVSYSPVYGIRSLYIIITIAYEEGLIIFVLDISNAFQNTILPYAAEIVYLILPGLYIE